MLFSIVAKLTIGTDLIDDLTHEHLELIEFLDLKKIKVYANKPIKEYLIWGEKLFVSIHEFI